MEGGNIKYQLTPSEDLLLRNKLKILQTEEESKQEKEKEKEKEKEEKESSYSDFFSFANGALSTAVLGGVVKIASNPKEKESEKEKAQAKSIHDVIAKINKNSEHDPSKGSKTHHALNWYNNKKLVKVLKKIADSTFENNFEKLEEALNSADNQNNNDIKLLKLNIGDLSILDAIDNLSVTRAGNSIEEISHSRENLKTMIRLIPKDEKIREEFFRISRDENFDLEITTPSKNPKNANATKFLQKVVKTH